MSSAKPLREFKKMDWVPINYGEVFDKRRPYPNQKGMSRALKVDFPLKKQAKNLYDVETVRSFRSSLAMMKWIQIT
jgi:hypothetical protein